MTPSYLRRAILPPTLDDSSTYISATLDDGYVIGHVFAVHWLYRGRKVCWITQLVVHRDYRNRGIAISMLRELRGEDVWVHGVASSQPFACMALARACGRGRDDGVGGIAVTDMSFIKENVEGVMAASPIRYVREGKVRGRLFGEEGRGKDVVCVVDTEFWVCHEEPMRAVEVLRERGREWPLGEGLPEGYEFMLMVRGCKGE